MATTTSCLRASQAAALQRMLDLNREPNEERLQDPMWKVLVYDAYCRDIISPLLKVGDLRKRGVTLHLELDADREVISDVPAIYFMQPTQANVRRLGKDCARALYESYYINFTPAVPQPLLEELAAATLESDSVSQVSRVMDQYLNFASLEDDLFSLVLPRCFQKFNSPSTADTDVEATVEAIVSGLFSAVVTLGLIPILRYKADGGPSQMVAEQLGRRLHDQLKAHPALFSDGQSAGFQRPLLVIMERSADLSVMIQHAWSYCALCHDLLDLKLNRVTIREASSEGGGPAKTKSYDLHAGDTFWAEHLGSAFPAVAEDVDRELNEYCAKKDSINSDNRLDATGDAALADSTRALASKINLLPELQMKKTLIDAHMNIATELLGKIRERSIDSYYAIEEAIMQGRSLSSEDKTTLPTLFEGSSLPEDRLRLLLVLYLHPGIVPAAEVAAFEATLEAAGTDMRPLAFLKKMTALSALQSSVREPSASTSSAGGGVWKSMMQVADRAGLQSVGAFANNMRQGVKQLLVSRRETPMTRAVTTLVANKGGAEDDEYAYLDPKLAPTAGAGGASRSRTPYSQAIVFVVGPGNYLEYQNLRQAVATPSTASSSVGRKVTYGCTEVLTPAEFVAQLATLGT